MCYHWYSGVICVFHNFTSPIILVGRSSRCLRNDSQRNPLWGNIRGKVRSADLVRQGVNWTRCKISYQEPWVPSSHESTISRTIQERSWSTTTCPTVVAKTWVWLNMKKIGNEDNRSSSNDRTVLSAIIQKDRLSANNRRVSSSRISKCPWYSDNRAASSTSVQKYALSSNDRTVSFPGVTRIDCLWTIWRFQSRGFKKIRFLRPTELFHFPDFQKIRCIRSPHSDADQVMARGDVIFPKSQIQILAHQICPRWRQDVADSRVQPPQRQKMSLSWVSSPVHGSVTPPANAQPQSATLVGFLSFLIEGVKKFGCASDVEWKMSIGGWLGWWEFVEMRCEVSDLMIERACQLSTPLQKSETLSSVWAPHRWLAVSAMRCLSSVWTIGDRFPIKNDGYSFCNV